jgi:hypothetical protein
VNFIGRKVGPDRGDGEEGKQWVEWLGGFVEGSHFAGLVAVGSVDVRKLVSNKKRASESQERS